MRENVKKQGKKMRTAVLALLSAAGMALLLNWALGDRARASEPDRTVNLGTVQLAEPLLPKEGKEWSGDHIYYGTYEGEPIKWRVLDTTGDAGSSSTEGGILLQSDQVLETMPFKSGEKADNKWNGSDIRAWLRGRNEFLSNSNFSGKEKAAIMQTTREAGESPVSSIQSQKLNRDTMFLLDISDLANNRYGYSYEDGSVSGKWNRSSWLRSAYAKSESGAGCILSGGQVFRDFVIEENGVMPAFNLKASAILFLTAADEPKSGSIEPVEIKEINEWKVTLSEGKTLETDAAARHSDEITVPYTYTGEDANQISVMIMEDEYGEDGAVVKYYGKVSDEEVGEEGTVTFTLPEEFDGENDRVYLLAEQVNDGNRTDYASEPVEVELPPAHEHQWKWECNEEAHWHVCTAPDCDLEPVEDIEDNEDYEEHDFGENEEVIIKEATEEEDGLMEILCDICEKRIRLPYSLEGPEEPEESEEPEEPEEPHEHVFVEVIVRAATCTDTGIKRRYCEDEDCEESYEEVIPALSAALTHTFGEWAQEIAPTTGSEGLSKRTCSVCGASQTTAIPKLAPKHKHDFREDVWMTDETDHWFQCECGETEDIESHEWNKGKILKKPTKKQEGEIQYRCVVCDRTVKRTIAKAGSKFTSGVYQYKAGFRDGYPIATLLGFAKGKRSKTVNIPNTASLKGVRYPVVKIADKAFASDNKIQKITVGNKVETIGNFAFFLAENIESIKLGTGVKEIGEHAFCHTYKLKLFVAKSKKLEMACTGILHGDMKNVLIKVPAKKVKEYQEDVFYTHPLCVKPLKNE